MEKRPIFAQNFRDWAFYQSISILFEEVQLARYQFEARRTQVL